MGQPLADYFGEVFLWALADTFETFAFGAAILGGASFFCGCW